MPYSNLTKGRFSGENHEYLVTATTYDRKPIFNDFVNARILVNEFKYQQLNNNAHWLTWVIMPDHFHILISLKNASLSNLMRDIKGRVSKNINLRIGTKGKIWQKGYYERGLRCEDDRKQIARYIVANPLRAKLVTHIGNYPHWDAVWL